VIWSTLVLAAAVGAAPAAEGELTLSNVRLTRGVLGPVRAEAKVLPGDNFFVCFDVEGVTVAEDGKVQYSTAIEVADPSGRIIFKQDPRDLEATCSLGGDRVPAYVSLDVGTQQQPGEYTLKVTVADRASGKKASLSRTVELLKPAFGLVRLTTTSDPDGLLPVSAPGVGEGLWLHFGAVGFERDGTAKQPNVTVTLRVLDEDGKPTLAKPMTGTVDKNVPEAVALLPMRMSLLLNRPGKFTVELTANDNVSRKTDKLTFPLTVYGK
jgi:hypothetical protein